MTPARAATWLLWAAAGAVVLLVAVDALAYGQVLRQGPAVAYPDPEQLARVKVVWPHQPQATAWLTTAAAPLLLLAAGLTAIGWMVRRGRPAALALCGLLAAGSLPLLMWVYETSPLVFTVSCHGCDFATSEMAPGPVWHSSARRVLLALLAVCLLGAVCQLARRSMTDWLRAAAGSQMGPVGRAPAARVAAIAGVAVAGAAGLIVAVNYLALGPGLADAQVDPWVTNPAQELAEAREAAGTAAALIAAALGPLAWAAALGAWAVWRGRLRRAATLLVAGGFTCGYAVIVFITALVYNPLGWNGELHHDMLTIGAPWYPPALSGLVLVGLATAVVLLVSLLRRATASWLTRDEATARPVPAGRS
ncbi:MAG: hypothetical protein ACRDTQ_05905 [Micromonosporaceae bacterium]